MICLIKEVKKSQFMKRFALITAFCLTAAATSRATNAGLKTLHGHVPALPPGLTAKGQLPTTNHLRLAIGLPMRDEAGLEDFLRQVYDPANANFHQSLSPEDFTARFGPAAEDYQAVIDFAVTNGLKVVETHGNRLLLDVEGRVDAIERAFHLTMRSYRDPKEARDFFAPDNEPSVAAQLTIADVSGLSNWASAWPPMGVRRAIGIFLTSLLLRTMFMSSRATVRARRLAARAVRRPCGPAWRRWLISRRSQPAKAQLGFSIPPFTRLAKEPIR
jgi:hypothetical protein